MIVSGQVCLCTRIALPVGCVGIWDSMALFKWLATAQQSCLLSLMQDPVGHLGLVIDQSVSNSLQVYAVDSQAGEVSQQTRVKLIASWTDRSGGEFQIEVMSDEPLLLQGTRCERVADALQMAFPPK